MNRRNGAPRSATVPRSRRIVASTRSRRSQQPPPSRQNRREMFGRWFSIVVGSTTIVTVAALASLAQSTPDVFVAASLVFSIIEGIVLAFIGAVWSDRGVINAVLAACVTAVLAAPSRWEVAHVRTGQVALPMDLLMDLGVTIAWAVFAGLTGATILRDRLRTLMPRR